MEQPPQNVGDQYWNHPATRWVALVPGAVVAAVMANIVTNLILVLWAASTGGGTWFGIEVRSDEPGAEVNYGLGFHLWKYVLRPGLIAGAFVYVGRLIAPAGKQFIGVLFAIITVLIAIGAYSSPVGAIYGHRGFWNWIALFAFPVGGIIAAFVEIRGNALFLPPTTTSLPPPPPCIPSGKEVRVFTVDNKSHCGCWVGVSNGIAEIEQLTHSDDTKVTVTTIRVPLNEIASIDFRLSQNPVVWENMWPTNKG